MRQALSESVCEDFLPILDVAYLELYTSNARQAAHFFCSAFGFDYVAYKGLETGNREKTSYLLTQGHIKLVVSSSYNPDNDIYKFLTRHGDGVRDIALEVSDVELAFAEASKRGAIIVREPFELTDQFGTVKKAVIATYGDTIHTLVEREKYTGVFEPGFVKYEQDVPHVDAGLIAVDHVVGNVEQMEEWVEYYERVMGFRQLIHFDDDDISTEYSALMSKVMFNGTGRIKFPINEPAEGKRKSQIQEYLDFYHGAGVQHVALLTNDIVHTISVLRSRGIQFLYTPDTYYDELSKRVGHIDEELEDLKRLHILVDRDDEGYLLQVFTKPLVDRPTLFFEIIQRKGSRGFGEGNFKALFEAIEHEQMLRGNL